MDVTLSRSPCARIPAPPVVLGFDLVGLLLTSWSLIRLVQDHQPIREHLKRAERKHFPHRINLWQSQMTLRYDTRRLRNNVIMFLIRSICFKVVGYHVGDEGNARNTVSTHRCSSNVQHKRFSIL